MEKMGSSPMNNEQNSKTKDPEMQWYWVSATYKSVIVGKLRRRNLWQDLVFLFQAVPDSNLALIAANIARRKQHTYLNKSGLAVEWVFQRINKVESLFDQEPKEGTEVFWRFYEKVDAK